jgi:hypothetical protein
VAETTTEAMFWGFDFSLRKEDMLPIISVASGNRDISVDGSLVSSSGAAATPNPITLSASGDTFAVPLSGLASPLIPSGFGIDLHEVVTGNRLSVIPNTQQISFSSNNLFRLFRLKYA